MNRVVSLGFWNEAELDSPLLYSRMKNIVARIVLGLVSCPSELISPILVEKQKKLVKLKAAVSGRSHDLSQLQERARGGAMLASLKSDSQPLQPDQYENEAASAAAPAAAVVTPGGTQTASVSTLTEVCYRDDVDEVDLISLIEEKIPKYILRADTLTDFAGYDNADWIQTPVLPLDVDLDLSPELIEETLKYFTLCAERVTCMTRTYNDIDAVTRLLEEKERDVELAARIGQQLLERNRSLETRQDELERLHDEAVERVKQLQHDVGLKDALLSVYNSESENESQSRERSPFYVEPADLEAMTKKLKTLEAENDELRVESSQLQQDTVSMETKEHELVKDVLKQLSESNLQVKTLQDDISTKADVALRQQEEITNLMAKNIVLDNRIQKLALENAEYVEHFKAAQDAQRELTNELGAMSERYEEVVALLSDAQDELKTQRQKEAPSVIRQAWSWYTPHPPEGSLAQELENTLKKDLGLPETEPQTSARQALRIMGAVRAVARQRALPSSSRSSMYLSEADTADGYQGDVDSSYGSMNTSRIGLAAAGGDEASKLYGGRRQRSVDDVTLSPPMSRARSPDSLFSDSDLSSTHSRMRNKPKLKIVKPLEGSATLGHWQRLATPNLGGILDRRPGVANRGAEVEQQKTEVFHLTDVEEDEPAIGARCRRWSDLNALTCTLTNSTVSRPSHDLQPAASALTSSALASSGLARAFGKPATDGGQKTEGVTTRRDLDLVKRVTALGLSAAPEKVGEEYLGLNNILTITTRSGPFPAAPTSATIPPRVIGRAEKDPP